MSEPSKRARRRADLRRDLDQLPAVERLAPDRWRVAWGGAAFECDGRSLSAALAVLTPEQRREVFLRVRTAVQGRAAS
jgi:hypothetical protein